MAITVNLSDGTTTINFVEGSPIDDFTLRANLGEGWLPKVAIPTGDGSIPDYITEIVPVWIESTSHTDFGTTMQQFHALQKRAAEYWIDPQQLTPVWWNVQTSGESLARRFLVKSLGLEYDLDFGGHYNDCPDLSEGRPAKVVIVRHPYGERPSALGAATGSSLSVIGGVFDYSGTDVVGDVGARIDNLQITTDNGDELTRAWMGFRSADKHGTLANFVPVWECDLGTHDTDTSTDDPDATARGAKSVECTFALDQSYVWRTAIFLSDISANESDNYGVFLMLMLMYVDAGVTAEVGIDQGFAGSALYAAGEKVVVTANAWTWYNMGVAVIPALDRRGVPTATLADSADSTTRLLISAARTAGAGSDALHYDCIVMIPLDEYFLFVDNVAFETTGTGTMILGVTPHDLHVVGSFNDGTAGDPLQAVGVVAPRGAGVPIGDGRMYAAFAEANDIRPTLAAVYGASVQLVPRWVTLRGTE